MKKSLKFISISHKTASLTQREVFHLTQIQQYQWFGLLRKKFLDIRGLMILSTCNRTEIYLESKGTTADEVCFFFTDNQNKPEITGKTELFITSNSTMETVNHLLQVGNGLQSAVVGDSEIMGQLKQAWQQSIQLNAQGSLLERAMQAAFRSHKRVVNDTNFHKGARNKTYRALPLATEQFNNKRFQTKRLIINMPASANIDSALLQKLNIDLNKLKSLMATLSALKANKRLAVVQVEKQIQEEIRDFSIWLKRQAIRDLLMTCKKQGQHISRYSTLNFNVIQKLNAKEFERLVNRISDKLVKETPMAVLGAKPDEISAKNLNRIIELVTNQQNQYEEDWSFSC